jgi:hypothetical protein
MQEKSAPARLGAPATARRAAQDTRGDPASASALRAWRVTHGHPPRSASGANRRARRASAVGRGSERLRRPAFGRFGGGCGAGETGAEQHFFLAMPENGPYSHISVARGEEFFGAKVQ